MSLRFRDYDPAREQQRNTTNGPSTSKARTSESTPVSPTSSTQFLGQQSRPRPQGRSTDPDLSTMLGGMSSSNATSTTTSRSSGRPEPLTKNLRFTAPTLQMRPRMDDPPMRHRSPEPFTPRGAYTSESDNESLWSSSNVSTTSTQATSVLSDDERAPKMPPVSTRQGRSNSLARRQSNTAGPLSRQSDRSDDRSSTQSQGRTVHIHIEPKAQPAPVSPPAALPQQQQPPMITHHQTPMYAQAAGTIAYHQPMMALPQAMPMHDNGSSGLFLELEALRREMNLLREKQSSAATELDDARQKVGALQKDKDALREERSRAQQHNDRFARDFEEQSRQLEKTRSKVDEQKKAIEKLEKDRRSIEKAEKEHAAAMQKIQRERDQAQATLKKDLGATIQKLEKERDDLIDSEKTSEGKIKDLEEHVARFREHSGNLEKRCESLEKESQMQMVEYKGQCDAKTVNLERELDDVKAIRRAQDTSYVAQIATMEMTMDAMQLRVDGLESDLVKNAVELGELTAQRDRLRQDVAEQKVTLNGLQSDKKSLEGQVKTLEADIEKNKQDAEGKDTRIAGLDGEVTDLKGRIETLQKEKESAEERVEDIEAKRKKLKKHLDNLRGESKDLQGKVDRLLKEQDDSSSRVVRLTEECDGLREENESLRASSSAGSVFSIARSVVSSLISDNANDDGDDATTAKSDTTEKAPKPVTVEDAAEPEPAPAAAAEPPAPEPPTGQASPTEDLHSQFRALEARNTELQEKAASVEALTTERDGIAEKLAAAEKDAALLPELRVENGALTAQLDDVKEQLETEKKAHQTASDEVTALRTQVNELLAQIALGATAASASAPSRGRTKSTSSKSSKRGEKLLAVRYPRDNSRGISVVRRKNLHIVRSASVSEGSRSE